MTPPDSNGQCLVIPSSLDDFSMLWSMSILPQLKHIEQTSPSVIANGRNTPWSGVTMNDMGAPGMDARPRCDQSRSCHDPYCLAHSAGGNNLLNDRYSPYRGHSAWDQWEPWYLRFSGSTVSDTAFSATLSDQSIISVFDSLLRDLHGVSLPLSTICNPTLTMADQDNDQAAAPAQAPDLSIFRVSDTAVLTAAFEALNTKPGKKVELGSFEPHQAIFKTPMGDKIVCNVSEIEFMMKLISTGIKLLRDHVNAGNKHSEFAPFIDALTRFTVIICNRMQYPFEAMTNRQQRFAIKMINASLDGTAENVFFEAVFKKFIYVRFGHEPFNGDEWQSLLYAILMLYVEETSDVHSAGEGRGTWTVGIAFGAAGWIANRGFTPIAFASSAADDERLATGIRRTNSNRITVDGATIKVEARDNVIAEMRQYLADRYSEDVDVVPADPPTGPTDEDDDEEEARPVVRMRNLFHEY